jgi:hypothetical protein
VIGKGKARNWVRRGGLGRGCSRGITGAASVSSTGKGKQKSCDVVGVAGALLVSKIQIGTMRRMRYGRVREGTPGAGVPRLELESGLWN